MDYSHGLQAAIRRARTEALANDHIHITLEHFLLGLTDDPAVESVIRHCGGSIVGIRASLIRYFIDECAEIVGPAPTTPAPTIDLNQVLRTAQTQASSRNQAVNSAHALFALLETKGDAYALRLLLGEHVTKEKLVQFFA